MILPYATYILIVVKLLEIHFTGKKNKQKNTPKLLKAFAVVFTRSFDNNFVFFPSTVMLNEY